jgi:D-3-phosphoglycerate dehydrogenase / 2-oxoglutarate reductase
MNKLILVTDALHADGLGILTNAGFEILQLNPDELELHREKLKYVSGWIIRSGTTITAALMNLTPNLRVIGRAGVGVDNIDLKEASRRGILVLNTPGGNTVSAAEHTIAMMMSLVRNIPFAHSDLMKGQWNRKKYVGRELAGKTLGVLGLGKIGREVIKRALGLQMKIVGFDPYVSPENFNDPQIVIKSFDDVIMECDILTIHMPKTKDTMGIINVDVMKKMKPESFIINVARGGIASEKDLAEALNSDMIAGAAVDVFDTEPMNDSPLLGAKNCVLTPHLGASTIEASEQVTLQICEQIVSYLSAEKIQNAVNLPIQNLSLLKDIEKEGELAEELGRMMHYLIPGAIKKVTLSFSGATKYLELLLMKFLQGFLKRRASGVVNPVNVMNIAKDAGIILETSTRSTAPKGTICAQLLSGETERMICARADELGDFRLRKIDDYRIEMPMRHGLLFVSHKDTPGMVGKLGKVLGDFHVNIANYALAEGPNFTAFSVISIDTEITNELLEKCASLEHVYSITTIPNKG